MHNFTSKLSWSRGTNPKKVADDIMAQPHHTSSPT